eukprot:1378442-Amphidinium_carterae.1
MAGNSLGINDKSAKSAALSAKCRECFACVRVSSYSCRTVHVKKWKPWSGDITSNRLERCGREFRQPTACTCGCQRVT